MSFLCSFSLHGLASSKRKMGLSLPQCHSLVRFPSLRPYSPPSLQFRGNPIFRRTSRKSPTFPAIRCLANPKNETTFRTCKNCKTQFDPSLNHPRACRYHTAHFGGETKRKFESVYSGGTMDTPESGKVFQYWHCCGSEDPFDPGCAAAPHLSYDD